LTAAARGGSGNWRSGRRDDRLSIDHRDGG
jgi:hypothetical protein